MVGADRRLALGGHSYGLALGGGDLRVTQLQDQANTVQQREHLCVVFADALHTDVAAQVVAATGAIALVTGIGRAAGEALGMQTAQLRFVFGHALGEQLKHRGFLAHGPQQELAEGTAIQGVELISSCTASSYCRRHTLSSSSWIMRLALVTLKH